MNKIAFKKNLRNQIETLRTIKAVFPVRNTAFMKVSFKKTQQENG